MRPQVGFSRPGQGPSSPQQYRSRYSESVFDVLRIILEMLDLYPDRDRNKERYDHEYGTEDRENQGVYRLDALDHYSADRVPRARSGEVGEVEAARHQLCLHLVLPTLPLGSSDHWSREDDRDSGTYDIYAAAADMPGAYPEGEGLPRDTEEDYYRLSMTTSNHGVFRFNDYDQGFNQEEHEDVQHIFNGDSYDGRTGVRGGGSGSRGQGNGRWHSQDGEDENSYTQSKLAKRDREREIEKQKGREARPTSPWSAKEAGMTILRCLAQGRR